MTDPDVSTALFEHGDTVLADLIAAFRRAAAGTDEPAAAAAMLDILATDTDPQVATLVAAAATRRLAAADPALTFDDTGEAYHPRVRVVDDTGTTFLPRVPVGEYDLRHTTTDLWVLMPRPPAPQPYRHP